MEEVTIKNYKTATEGKFTTIKPVSVTDAISQASMMSGLGVDRLLPRQVATGTYRGQQAVGSNRVLIDSAGGRILIGDGNTNRFLAGSKSG